jgi:hypothetical protein
MQIIEKTRTDECNGPATVFIYKFDREWTRPDIEKLSSLGEIEYFSDFPKPFFRVRSQNGISMKGLEGSASCRVILPSSCGEDMLAPLHDHFLSGENKNLDQISKPNEF